MEVYHEKFGTGTILKSTEQFDEAGNIVSADVMFEHGIEQDVQLEEIEDLDEKLSGNQHKIDANKNGKVDAHDFKLLRGKKTDTDESADDKDDMKEGKISKALTGAAIAATLSAGGMMAKGAHDYHQKDPRIAMSQYDLDKMGGKDFTKMKESVEVAPRMTPDSASMRMPAVESVVRDIMSQQRNLRQEAKIAEFKSRNK